MPDPRPAEPNDLTHIAGIDHGLAARLSADGTTFAQIALPRLMMGFGMATFFVPLTALILSEIPPQQLPSATGLSNFARLLGGSFGTSLSITAEGAPKAVKVADSTATKATVTGVNEKALYGPDPDEIDDETTPPRGRTA